MTAYRAFVLAERPAARLAIASLSAREQRTLASLPPTFVQGNPWRHVDVREELTI